MAKKSGVWIHVITIVKEVGQSLENPRCVSIEESEQGYSFIRQLRCHIAGVIATIPIVRCMGD